jgi:hypothetical protein
METDLKVYEPLKEKIDEFGSMKVEVFYTLGGMNYFSGEVQRRGIKLLLKPVNRSVVNGHAIESSVMMSRDRRKEGFAVVLEELNRKSQKKLVQWFNKIKPFVKDIVALYEAGQYQEIIKLVNGQ